MKFEIIHGSESEKQSELTLQSQVVIGSTGYLLWQVRLPGENASWETLAALDDTGKPITYYVPNKICDALRVRRCQETGHIFRSVATRPEG